MKISSRSLTLTTALAPMLVLSFASMAAATTSTATLPWEGTLQNLSSALTGSTAKVICMIAIFVAGTALIFGEDLGAFAKRLLMIVIATAFLISAGAFLTGLGQTGVLI